MLKVAIVGCGKIADQHVAAIDRIEDCKIVAVCDRELLMARQLAERFRINGCFSDVGQMLKDAAPDVVHVTTPPSSHFSLGQQCLEAGCHVYLEKPFTVTADEARTILRLAETRKLKVTAGHNYQFTLEMLELRKLIKEGFLGGAPVHLESHWAYDLGDVSYVGPLLGNKDHWVRRLPGQLFHNLISHGIAKIAEFLQDDLAEVVATAHQSPQLTRLGGQDVLDELRVMVRDRAGTTAFFCFSTQIKPGLSHLRVCGPVNSLVADMLTGTCIRVKSVPSKSYLTYVLPPLHFAREYLRNARHNVADFVRRRLYQDFGMKELISGFYQSIKQNTAPPIPYREILLTARIMDEVFAQVYPKEKGLKAEDSNRMNGDRGQRTLEPVSSL